MFILLNPNSYTFYYDNENDITFLCMGQNLTSEFVFSYLSELKRKFFLSYELQNVKKCIAYQLKEFSNEIKKLNDSYIVNSEDKVKELRGIFSKKIFKENAEKLLEKGDLLKINVQTSDRLRKSSDDFIKNIHDIKRKEKRKKLKYFFILVAFAVFTILIIRKIKK